MRHSRLLLILAVLSLGFSAVMSFSSPADKPKKRDKDDGDRGQYYKRWLEEDVLYIISPDERKVFKDLSNDEERENFIEDFWNRRNPNRRSGGYNPFKEEHYRRIAYANEHFASGVPGWKTDRGMIYIKFGKPDQLESHPTGGYYARPYNEGGGITSTYPFEKWWYRHIDGVGDDIEIEFVDQSQGNEYRIAMSKDEKDALLHVPEGGLTLAEEQGLMNKEDRAYFNPGAWNSPDNPLGSLMRYKDTPFGRMEQYFDIQRPPEIKFDDLKALVTTSISYNTLPYDVRTDFIKLSSDRVLVPITVEVSNKDLEFKKESGFNRATVNVYGIVTGLNNRIVAEFEDVIAVEFSDEYFELGKNQRSEYQHVIAVPPGGKYKLEMVLEDLKSKSVGSRVIGLNSPKFDETTLQASSIILANAISEAPSSSNQLEEYVIGDLKILPNVKSEYVSGQNLKLYMQVYNAAIDQTTLNPALEVSFVIKKDGKVITELQDNIGKSLQLVSGFRIVLLNQIPLRGIPSGKYSLEVTVTDTILNRTVASSTSFKVKDPVAPALTASNP